MTRRIVRTISQVATAALLTLIVVFFLDRNFRVLPTSIHEFMPTHHAGAVAVDLTIATCSSVNPFSSCRLDPEVWRRVDQDLYLGSTFFSSAYLHVRLVKESDLTPDDRVVVDVTVGRLNPATAAAKIGARAEAGGSDSSGSRGGSGGGGSNNGGSVGGSSSGNSGGAAGGEPWESRPGGLWIRRSSKRHASDSKDAVTDVDVLFGDDAVEARDGWEIRGTPLLLGSGGGASAAAHVTIRRGAPREPARPQPRVGENGRFKVMQLADLHLSTGVGHCRDAMPDGPGAPRCEADPRTLDFVTRVLEDEKPDLVVLSGDQVNGDTAPDAQSAIFKYAQILIKHKVPYVTIFGNHDDEGSLPRENQMALVESLPYSLSKAGPEDVDGVGNYYVEVLSRGRSGHSAITLYLLDTHAYSPDERNFQGYDWIRQSQIDWFRETSQGLKRKHKEYTHVHLDVAFIHIPLPEYRIPEQYHRGEWKEPPTAPLFNSGFRDALVEQGVVMVSCGHDHVNEYCMLSPNEKLQPALWMCYGGGTGFGGYAGYGGFHRKIRMFDFDMNEARITTWKRVEYGDVDKRLDEQILVNDGKPVAPME